MKTNSNTDKNDGVAKDAPVSEYRVYFDHTGASCVDREALLAHPNVRRQIDAAQRIVKAHTQKQMSSAILSNKDTNLTFIYNGYESIIYDTQFSSQGDFLLAVKDDIKNHAPFDEPLIIGWPKAIPFTIQWDGELTDDLNITIDWRQVCFQKIEYNKAAAAEVQYFTVEEYEAFINKPN